MVRFHGRLSRKTACVRLNGDDDVVTDSDSLNVVGCSDGLDGTNMQPAGQGA